MDAFFQSNRGGFEMKKYNDYVMSPEEYRKMKVNKQKKSKKRK